MSARRHLHGFTLVELLVAMAVFATMAALAYGGLNSIARTRSELARQEDQFRNLTRAVETLKRDLGEAVSRSVRGSIGNVVPAFLGAVDHVEFTRLGFANPQSEQRSNLERVIYELDANSFKRGRYAVLDRVQDSQPVIADLHVAFDAFRLRYMTADGQWVDTWPPSQVTDPLNALPHAVQWTFQSRELGEIEGVVTMVSPWPVSSPR